jgi:hypothetical protein
MTDMVQCLCMSEIDTEGTVYSVGQVAEMLGCSVRSLYRWEDSNVIPKAQRIDRGGVSARIYTESQVEEIRKKVADRIVFTAIVSERSDRPSARMIVRERKQVQKPRKVVHLKKKYSGRDVIETITPDADSAPLFFRMMRDAKKKPGCIEGTLTWSDGEKRTYQMPTDKRKV